ncbi:hypothetical protein QJQ45_005151 [Haematococcus lacustris]|nr:hypothetical protein QJQ45_005151 [Haematococcus lacustris]
MQMAVYFGNVGDGRQSGWGAYAVLQACRKVVKRPNSGNFTDGQRGVVVTVDEFSTSRVSSVDPPAPAHDPLAPPPAQEPPPPPPAQEPPPPAQDQPPAQAPPGPVPPPQAPSWGRWLDRDTNACFNFQRIGESMQRPLELCSWTDLKALPPVGKEYLQGYKRVNDRLPKIRQRLHRAAEYRRGIDGRARNNA